MLIGIVGIALAFNLIILIWKVKKARYVDFLIDITCMIFICWLFSTTMTSLCIGMIGSMLVSLYLLIRPIRIFGY